MKKILVLTDLTEGSGQATEAAVMLSAKLHANLILFNTFISQPALSEYGSNPWYTEEILWENEAKERLVALKDDALQLVEGLAPEVHHASIESRQGIGNLGLQVEDLIDKENVEIVVMGARTGSAWDHILMGSDTISVISHADRPVLVVPADHRLKQLTKVTIATDLDDPDLTAVHYLTRIGRLFDFAIEIVHVKIWGETSKEESRYNAFKKHVAKFNYPHISHLEVSGKELSSRLNGLCKAGGSDLLVLVHNKHSLLDRILNKSHAKSLLEKQELPVMIIPSALVIH